MICQPLYTIFSESVPLWISSGNTFLLSHLAVKLLTKEMGTFKHNQTSVVRATRKDINQVLHQTESRTLGMFGGARACWEINRCG